MRDRVWGLAKSIVCGWATLFVLTFLLQRPLRWAAPLLGASWIATVSLTLECAALVAAGWVAGRLNRPDPLIAVLVFAATLSFWDFGDALSLNVPWLIRLTADAIRDPLYRESWFTTVATHALLFGSLIGGGLLSRPRPSMQGLGIRA